MRGPRGFLGLEGGAGVGGGPGNAVGSTLALMEYGKTCVSVVGDGDLMQGVTALWTAAHYKIPAMIVVVNNGTHLNDEMISERIAKMRGRPLENAWIGQRFTDPRLDLPSIARGQGVHAIGTVKRADDLPRALEEAFEVVSGGDPVLVDVLVEQRTSAVSQSTRGVESAGSR